MSDDLDRAIDAGIDAHRPAYTPPFDAIVAKGRRRDRGRLAAATAGVALLAVATAALALPGTGSERPERLAAGDPPVSEPVEPAWDGRSGPLAEAGISRASCVEAYSPQTLPNRAFAFDGTVTAIGESVTNRADKGQLELAGVTFAVSSWFRGGEEGAVTVDLPAPVPAGSAMGQDGPSYGVGSRLLVSGEPRWGGEPLDQPIAWTACGGFTRYYDPETAQAWQDAFAAQEAPGNLRLTTDGVGGATLCLADSGGAYSDSGCRPIGRDGAARLTRALDGAQPQGSRPLCNASGPTYRLTFDMPAARVIPIIIPTPCGPIAVGDGRYLINDRVVRGLSAEYGRDAKYAEFIDRCIADADPVLAPEYVGLTEAEATLLALPAGTIPTKVVQILGQDGTCLPTLEVEGKQADLRFVLDGDRVIWAGHFS